MFSIIILLIGALDLFNLNTHIAAAYAPCAWGSMGCGGGLAPVRNSIRVLLRSMFYPSALNRKKGVLTALVCFLRRCVGL